MTVNSPAVLAVQRRRWHADAVVDEIDEVAIEAPLTISTGGEALSVIMRTPGDDEDLVAGFLHGEGVTQSAGDLLRMRRCDQLDATAAEHVVQVLLSPEATARARAYRRPAAISSSCGLCGRGNVEELLSSLEVLGQQLSQPFAPAYVRSLAATLARQQSLFDRTGATHAAAFIDVQGQLVCLREDVGRHNAVDKVVGAMWRAGTLSKPGVLAVSGRVSAEIVQKANRARWPVIVAVSAPTSLAVEMAQHAEMTLIGFSRGSSFNVYTGAHRILGTTAS